MSDFVNLAEVVKDNIASSNLAIGGSLTVGGGQFIQQEITAFINFPTVCF